MAKGSDGGVVWLSIEVGEEKEHRAGRIALRDVKGDDKEENTAQDKEVFHL
jgi:hypothetical protein